MLSMTSMIFSGTGSVGSEHISKLDCSYRRVNGRWGSVENKAQ